VREGCQSAAHWQLSTPRLIRVARCRKGWTNGTRSQAEILVKVEGIVRSSWVTTTRAGKVSQVGGIKAADHVIMVAAPAACREWLRCAAGGRAFMRRRQRSDAYQSISAP